MAQEVRRFSIESDVKLPPVAVVAASYMLENQDEFVSLDAMLLCTAREGKSVLPRLSHRGKRIMALLASSLVAREVALNMCLTEKTVRNYLSGICKKRQVRAYGATTPFMKMR
jgi:DNA-binding CsgD family transcriptional regulator